jgi:putative transposase
MPNHVHVIASPRTEDALAKSVGRTHFRYTQYINRLHGRSGHLWQARFHSCPLDDAHAWTALRYVERNPVRAGMVRRPWRYPWSSATLHVGMTRGGGPVPLKQWQGVATPDDWRHELCAEDDQSSISALRASTCTGRPLGTDSFLSKVEALVGRRLRALPVGRPRGRKKRPQK